MAITPFPISAHRTGGPDFRSPALRLASPQGTRRGSEWVAASLGFGGLDEAVDGLDDAVGNLGVEPAENAAPVAFDHACRRDHRRQAAMGGPPVPFLEERLGDIGGLDVELLEGEAHAVCPPGLEVRGGEAVQLGALALRQVARVLEPEIAPPLQFVAAFLFAAANRVDGFVDELDDVEFVESDLGVGQAF